jgi:hypothetical protein
MQLTNAEIQIIRTWKAQHHLGNHVSNLLVEAYRRYHMFHKDEDLTKAWVGLGDKTTYVSKYFKTHDGISNPDNNCWWVLTDIGVEAIKTLLANLKWRKEFEQLLFCGTNN